MKTFLKGLDKLEEYLLIGLLTLMTVVIVGQVICRFVLGFSIPWSEEAGRYMLVWTTFLGASVGIRKGSHIGVEAFTLLVPMKVRKYVNALAFVLCAVFCALVFQNSLTIIGKQMANNQVSPAMQIPMWIAYLAIPVGTLLMTIRFIQSTFTTLRGSENIEAQQSAGKEA